MAHRRNFPEPTEEEKHSRIQEDINVLSGAISAARLPSLNNIPAEESRPFDRPPSFTVNLDLSTLVSTRQAHETKHAAASVRTRFKDEPANVNVEKEVPIRRRIYREMNEVLKEEQDQRINTGSNRITTWTNSAPGGRSNEQISTLAGNSANAELAAGQRALTVSDVYYIKPIVN
jgi:hypothetical protein